MSCRSVGSHRVAAQRDNQSQHGLLYTPSPSPPLCQSLCLPLLFQSLHSVKIILYLIAYCAHICQLHFCLLMHSSPRQFKYWAAAWSLYNHAGLLLQVYSYIFLEIGWKPLLWSDDSKTNCFRTPKSVIPFIVPYF